MYYYDDIIDDGDFDDIIDDDDFNDDIDDDFYDDFNSDLNHSSNIDSDFDDDFDDEPEENLLDDDFSDDSDHAFEIGDPDDSGFIQQTTNQTCAVVSQEMVLKEFDINVSESQLVIEAKDNGWLNGGTKIEDMGKLLELHGVSNHQGAGFENMINELAEGHKVIVAVDSDEIWHHPLFDDFFDGGKGADHAIVVKGIKENDDGELVVVVNDPGNPNGAGAEYPIEQFEDAFADSGFSYIATDHAPDNFLPDDSLFATIKSKYSTENNENQILGAGMNNDENTEEHFYNTSTAKIMFQFARKIVNKKTGAATAGVAGTAAFLKSKKNRSKK